MISIRRQLTRHLLGASLGLLALGIAALLTVAAFSVVRQFDIALQTKALAISTATRVTEDAVRFEFTDLFLVDFDDVKPRDFFELWHSDGTILARSESLGTLELPHLVGSIGNPRYFLCTLPNGRPGRAIGYVFETKQAPGVKRKVVLELVVATDRDSLDTTLLQMVALAAVCGLLLLGATLWVVPRVLRRGLQPLDVLGELAEQIDASSLAARFPVETLPEELQSIGRRLNDLIARLEQSFERERRFSGDLAHELRTPIAELRSLAECALKWPETRDGTTDREALAIASHMEALTTRMLTLARGGNGAPANLTESFALAPLVEEVWRSFAARASSLGMTVDFSLTPAQVVADPVLMRSILANLFSNAVAYTPSEGRISIRLEQTGAGVVFTVTNPAENLVAADVTKLFDPFWRKEASRSGGEHFGLGLSLAQSFAKAMNWTLSAALGEDQRLSMLLAPASRARL